MGDPDSPILTKCQVLAGANDRVIAGSASEGALRDDVETLQVCRLVGGVATVADQGELDEAAVRPLLEVVADGLVCARPGVHPSVDPEDETPRAAAPGWPPPHPSPPLPPPREYGAPRYAARLAPWLRGRSPPSSWQRWSWSGSSCCSPVTATTAEPTGVRSSGRPSPARPRRRLVDRAPAGTAAPYRCWDGSDAQTLRDCSRPTGEQGLPGSSRSWPSSGAGSRPQTGSGRGAAASSARRGSSDGSRVQLGYYQWESVRAGVAFYGAQDLTRADENGFHRMDRPRATAP